MAVHFNHTILSARDSKASAKFLAEMLNLPAPKHWGPFEMVATENGAYLDYMDTDQIARQHYAFLVSEPGIDQVHWFAVAGMNAVPVVAVEGKAGIALGAGFLPASGLGGVGRNYRVDVSWST